MLDVEQDERGGGDRPDPPGTQADPVLQPQFELIFCVTGVGGARCLVMVGDDLDLVAAADLALLDEWAAGLEALGELIGPRFFRREPRARALAYVKGLLSRVATRNGWTLAEAAGEKTPTGMQRLLNDAVWDEAGVREDLRRYVVTHLGAPTTGCWCSTRPGTSSRATTPWGWPASTPG